MNERKAIRLGLVMVSAYAVAVAACFIVPVACTPAQRAIAKTAFDVASEACRFAYGQRPEELPPGVSLKDFCDQTQNLRPFVDSILSAQREQAERLGTRRPADAGAD